MHERTLWWGTQTFTITNARAWFAHTRSPPHSSWCELLVYHLREQWATYYCPWGAEHMRLNHWPLIGFKTSPCDSRTCTISIILNLRQKMHVQIKRTVYKKHHLLNGHIFIFQCVKKPLAVSYEPDCDGGQETFIWFVFTKQWSVFNRPCSLHTALRPPQGVLLQQLISRSLHSTQTLRPPLILQG